MVGGSILRGKMTSQWGLKLLFFSGKTQAIFACQGIYCTKLEAGYLFSYYLTKKRVCKVILQKLFLNKVFIMFACILM